MLRSTFPTRPTRRTSRRRAASAAGFTLNEVLISLGILAVGITAVASLFPPAILMQKETVRDVLAQQNVRSSDALLRAKGINGDALFRFTDNLTGPTNRRTSSDDIDDDNTMGAAIARGADVNTAPSKERYIVPEPEFDIFALAEADAYMPPLDPNATSYVIPPTTPGPSEGVANYQFPDMRAYSDYGASNPPPGIAPRRSYSQHQSLLANWGEIDRSFPSYVANPADRELYIVPLFRRGLQASEFAADYQVFSMILERYPEDIEDIDLDPGPYDSIVLRAPYMRVYPSYGSIPEDDARNTIVCANPYDNPNYFPKVFRIPAVDNTLNERDPSDIDPNAPGANPFGLEPDEIQLLVPNEVQFPADGSRGLLLRPGDMMLTDTGRILRVVGYPNVNNLTVLRVSEETRQSTGDFLTQDRSMRAVWIAMRPTAAARSPLRDIRVLSGDVIRSGD